MKKTPAPRPRRLQRRSYAAAAYKLRSLSRTLEAVADAPPDERTDARLTKTINLLLLTARNLAGRHALAGAGLTGKLSRKRSKL